jgi:hypothetical protein
MTLAKFEKTYPKECTKVIPLDSIIDKKLNSLKLILLSIADSLICVSKNQSMALRKRVSFLFSNPKTLESENANIILIESLTGVDDNESMEIRNDLLTKILLDPTKISPPYLFKKNCFYEEDITFSPFKAATILTTDNILESLIGTNSAKSMELRKKLLDIGANEHSLLLSLAGVKTEEAMEFRLEIFKRMKTKYINWIPEIFLLDSLKGVDSEKSIKLRFVLLRRGIDIKSIVESLVGVSHPEATKLRKKILRERFDPYVISKSLAGVNDEESMKLRKKLFEKYRNVEEIEESGIHISLAGLHTEEAYELREKYLSKDPNLYVDSFVTYDKKINAIICRFGFEK